MHCNVDTQAIATTIVRTPQRKANYKNKERFRLKDLKRIAFREYGCGSTVHIKCLLQQLGIKLDLRLTSAWDAIVFELRSRLKQLCSPIKPGALVGIKDCPANLYFWMPFKIATITDGMAELEYVASPFPVDRLKLWEEDACAAA